MSDTKTLVPYEWGFIVSRNCSKTALLSVTEKSFDESAKLQYFTQTVAAASRTNIKHSPRSCRRTQGRGIDNSAV